MQLLTPHKQEEGLHALFEISLAGKAVVALSEIAAGLAAYFGSLQFLAHFVLGIAAQELVEDPHDAIANFLIKSVGSFSVSSQHFMAFFLLSHGIIKLILIIGLFRKKLAYYPAAVVVFALFIIYQLYRYSFTHSAWLLILTALDGVVIWLTVHEYRYLKEHSHSPVAP